MQASAHHASVNFGQYDFASLLLNVSSMVRRPIPRPPGKQTADDQAAYQVGGGLGTGRGWAAPHVQLAAASFAVACLRRKSMPVLMAGQEEEAGQQAGGVALRGLCSRPAGSRHAVRPARKPSPACRSWSAPRALPRRRRSSPTWPTPSTWWAGMGGRTQDSGCASLRQSPSYSSKYACRPRRPAPAEPSQQPPVGWSHAHKPPCRWLPSPPRRCKSW